MNKTEALREKMGKQFFQFRFNIPEETIDAEWEFQEPKSVYYEPANQILRACKESGLEFVIRKPVSIRNEFTTEEIE